MVGVDPSVLGMGCDVNRYVNQSPDETDNDYLHRLHTTAFEAMKEYRSITGNAVLSLHDAEGTAHVIYSTPDDPVSVTISKETID